MKSTWYELPTVGRRSHRGISAEDRADPRDLTLVRNPWALETKRAAWLFIFVSGLVSIVIISTLKALTWRTVEGVGFSIICLCLVLCLTYALVSMIFFSRERVGLDSASRSLAYTRVEGIVRKQRMIPLKEILRVRSYSVMVDGGRSQPSHPEYGVLIESIGRPLRIGQGRDPDEADRLQEWIESQLLAWEPTWDNVPCCEDREVMNASCTLPEEPSDCTIDCRREWDRTEFRIRISAKIWFTAMLLVALVMVVSAMPGALFFSLFGPRVGWFILPYLILLGSAGVIWVFPWVSWQSGNRRWVVRPGEITMSVPMVGIGRTRTIEVEWLDRIELRRIRDAPWRWVPSRIEVGSSPFGFELVLVDLDEHDLAILGPLSEGEARWMAGIVAEVLKDALLKSGQTFERWSVSVDAPAGGSQSMGDVYLDEPMADVGSKGSTKAEKAQSTRQ
jgi:hypothetical protein